MHHICSFCHKLIIYDKMNTCDALLINHLKWYTYSMCAWSHQPLPLSVDQTPKIKEMFWLWRVKRTDSTVFKYSCTYSVCSVVKPLDKTICGLIWNKDTVKNKPSKEIICYIWRHSIFNIQPYYCLNIAHYIQYLCGTV